MNVSDKIPELTDHSFLAELLLQPNSNKTDGSRSQMFTSNLVQAVVLNEPQIPMVFSRFENQVGSHSSSFKKLDREMVIAEIIEKNKLNKIYILQSNDDEQFVQLVEDKPCFNITENYGYRLKSNLNNHEVGDILPKGFVLYHSTAYDDQLNFGYGRNLNTVFMPWRGMTYEDAIVISDVAAEQMSHTSVSHVYVTINTNDILLNLYGDKENYKPFPEIGETIKDGILCARRRIAYESAFVELADSMIQKSVDSDTHFYEEGEVVDISVFSNVDSKELARHTYNKLLAKYLDDELEFRGEIVETLEELVEEHGEGYCDETGYLFKRSQKILDKDISWTFEKSEFDVLVVKFTIVKTNKVAPGSKLTNRYGGKGVVSAILPQSEMPRDEFGSIADVVLNPLGIINRLNPSQLVEQEITHAGRQVREKMRKLLDDGQGVISAWSTALDYVRVVNSEQADHMIAHSETLDDRDLNQMVQDMIANGIPIHQPPFFNNISPIQLRELYKAVGFEPRKLYIPHLDSWTENPLVMGTVYTMKLKHEAKSKFSARSAKHVSMRDIPAKNNREFKSSQSLYSTTPVRIGEQELTNLLVLPDVEKTFRYINQLSSNKGDRHKLIRELLEGDVLNLKRVDSSDEESHTASILGAYLQSLGIEIVTD